MKTEKISSQEKVRTLYENSAEWYADMMDAEIDLPVYADIMSRLAERIAGLPGPVIDTSCGSGHMLARYHERYDSERSLLGIDLSPRMVEIAGKRLGAAAEILTGDMCRLNTVTSDSVAAVLSFFALHHLDAEKILEAFREWHRVLGPNGQLSIAAWEGNGPVDYGNESDVVALRYSRDEFYGWAQKAGFIIDRCVVAPVEGMTMDAIYLEGTRS